MFLLTMTVGHLIKNVKKTFESEPNYCLTRISLKYIMVMNWPALRNWRNTRRRHFAFVYELGWFKKQRQKSICITKN
jgi:hypothetical protein